MKICHHFCKPFSDSAELLLAPVDLVKYFMTFFIITFFYLFGTVLFTSCLLYFYPWKYFIKLKKNHYGPFSVDGVQLSQGYRATTRRQFTFYHSFPRNSWYSFDRSMKYERLSCLWSRLAVLNMGPLN